jgi:hypothetical protein
MKTLPLTPSHNVTANPGRYRLLLTLAGIVIAVLCWIALIRDVRSEEHMDVQVLRFQKSAKIFPVDLFGHAKTWL